MAKTIFITGASRGFGKIWAEAFLKRGDKVAATARNLDTLSDLVATYGDAILPIQLDVNDRAAGFAAVKKAKDTFGSIDVLINNAGFGLFGAIEETTEEQARQQIETNVFGLLWISVLGVATLPVLGIYNASKFAVEGLSETLAAEVKDFGIKVSLIEPNGFSTDWAGASSSQTEAIEAYAGVKAAFQAGLTNDAFGNPEATTPAILKLVDSENPPLRLFLGKVAFPWVKQLYASRLAEWEEWSEVATAAHGH